jgi:hypothetical protein
MEGAEKKLLYGPAGGVVAGFQAPGLLEMVLEDGFQGGRLIAPDYPAAALFGAVNREGGHQHMTPWFYSPGGYLPVCFDVGLFREKMEGCPVVPKVIGFIGPEVDHVRDHPPHLLG